MMEKYTGEEFHKFNDLFQKTKFFILTNEGTKDNPWGDSHYKTGLNCSKNAEGYIICGNFVFCAESEIADEINYNCPPKFIREVTLPPDANVYVRKFSFETDKIIMAEKKEIWSDAVLCANLVKKRWEALWYVEESIQTEQMYLNAINLCWEGVKMFLPEHQTLKVAESALQKDIRALEYVRTDLKTESMCLEAVKKGWWALKWVDHKLQNKEMCIEALRQNSEAKKWIRSDILDEIKSLTIQSQEILEHIIISRKRVRED